MRIFNKFIESKKEPSNKNDIWFDGSVFRIYKEEEWQAFTVNLNDANEIAKLKDELYEFLYDEAKPTVEEAKQAAATIQEYVDKAIDALVLAQQSLANSESAITEATALKSQTEQLIEQGNIVVENANKATDNANETSSNIKAIWDDLFVEINNSIASANEAAINANTAAETIDSKVESLQTQFDNHDTLIEDLQENKADVSGYYPKLSVGQADNLPDRGDVTEGLIGFRESAGADNSIEDGTANVQELLGNSVVWNQLILRTYKTTTYNGVTFTVNEDGSVVANGTASATAYIVIKNNFLTDASHKYAVFGTPSGGSTTTFYFGNGNALNDKDGNGSIVSGQGSTSTFACRVQSGITVTNAVYRPRLYDLTQMFGAGNEPNTIEEFYARIPMGVDLNAYNEGEVLGVNIKGIKSVNDNAWDEEWVANANTIISKNFNRCIGGETYHVRINNADYDDIRFWVAVRWFDKNKNQIQEDYCNNKSVVSPSNAWYFKISTNSSTYVYGNTYNHDICIRLAHSGYKTEYVPHEEAESSFDLTPYFPNGMHGINGVRDSATKSKATRRFGMVKMKDLSWSYFAAYGFYATVPSDMVVGNLNYLIERPYTKFANPDRVTWEGLDKSVANGIAVIGTSWARFLVIKDSAYTDAASFKASFTDDDILIYELATPIETEIDPQLNMNYKVWDFGTEEILTDSKSALVLARTIYGFNATDTIRGNKEKIKNNEERIRELESEAVRGDDYQPNLSVGLADNLAGVDVVDSEVNFRRSGGGAITDGVARIEAIKGNSVVWNQRYPTGWERKAIGLNIVSAHSKIEISGTLNNTYFNLLPFTANIPGHIYAFALNDAAVFNGLTFALMNRTNSNSATIANGAALFIYTNTIEQSQLATNIGIIGLEVGRDISTIIKLAQYDLTKMFGAGNEPTTIEEFYSRIPMGVDLNAYNEGEVIHMDVQSIESQGVNAWDGELEKGRITNGEDDNANQTMARSMGYINIIPNTAYYATCKYLFYAFFYDEDKNLISNTNSVKTFTTPSNARYLRFFLYNSNGTVELDTQVCINISDTSINGNYFPYIKRVEDLSIIRNYFPQGMKSAGSAHDEIRYNKATQKWEMVQRIGTKDMSEIKWVQRASESLFYAEVPLSFTEFRPAYNKSLVCARYATNKTSEILQGLQDREILLYNGASYPLLGVKDSAYTDAASFKAAMAGVMLYYELAEPIVTELDAEDQFKDLDYQVWNCGTEKAIAEGISAPLAADITYGFNAIGKIKELEEAIKALQTKVASL